jgi:hypothetical protein
MTWKRICTFSFFEPFTVICDNGLTLDLSYGVPPEIGVRCVRVYGTVPPEIGAKAGGGP